MPRTAKTYVGTRNARGDVRIRVVDIDGRTRDLEPRTDLFNHSPTGFEFGYAGSGPAQLALAILADVLHDDRKAVEWHQRFKFDRISPLPRDEPWSMSEGEVREWLAGVEAAKGEARA